MKSLMFIMFLCANLLILGADAQDKPFRPATANIPAEDYTTSGPETTAEELAIPPVGEIQKIHLYLINSSRNSLAAILAATPAGADGQASPWFAKAQTFKSGLDTLATSRLQTDCFTLIPQIEELLKTRGQIVPEFASKAGSLASGISEALINAIERHIIDQNATVSAANLNAFIKVFSIAGFPTESDWEASPIPIDSAGIMILDAAAVVTQLKTRPWQEADQFLGNATATEAFGRYAPSGNGMAILKTKYASNQLAITAKWNELAAWVVTQHPPN
jgi:hypothetical protein